MLPLHKLRRGRQFARTGIFLVFVHKAHLGNVQCDLR